jgi:glycine hydroxymethyltransferase
MHIIAAKAVCFQEAAEPSFRDYQQQTVNNAFRLGSALQDAGFRLVGGGTDNHLVLVDVFSRGITGHVAEEALGGAGITVNKNAIPFDENPPMVASGIRIGTPAVTTRGMAEPEMDLIASYITRVLASPDNEQVSDCARSSHSIRAIRSRATPAKGRGRIRRRWQTSRRPAIVRGPERPT